MNAVGGESRLQLGEAVLLCHVLVHQVAVDAGVRAFFIKGPVSVSQGLRPPKVSTDVDVFVEPGLDLVLQDAMFRRGWKPRPTEPDEAAFPRHSRTLFHPQWPCDIDIHFRFPGMEAEATECFEAMWRSTERSEVGGHLIPVPSRRLAVCLLALHALRTPWIPQSQADLDFLIGLGLDAEKDGLLSTAAETECRAALHPFFSRISGNDQLNGTPPVSNEWKMRTLSRAPGSARIISLLEAPFHRWPTIIFRATFPSRETLLAKDLYADLSLRGRSRLYIRRWAVLTRSIPSVIEDIRSVVLTVSSPRCNSTLERRRRPWTAGR